VLAAVSTSPALESLNITIFSIGLMEKPDPVMVTVPPIVSITGETERFEGIVLVFLHAVIGNVMARIITHIRR